MTSHDTAVDFRKYRPAAVVVLDLVKHSTKARAVAAEARAVLERVLASNVQALALRDVVFNFTGDGYVCALLGDESCRLIDFLTCTIPQLRDELRSLDQAFRCGVAFGFVHLTDNVLTRSAEHFDVPGVIAARLEQAAAANEILASETVHNLFAPLYPQVFRENARAVHVKDHILTCYALTPIDFGTIRELIRSTLFEASRSVLTARDVSPILVAEDDVVASTLIEIYLTELYPGIEIITVTDGSEALLAVKSKRFAAAILDVNIPTLSGLRVAEFILRDQPDAVVILVSGVASTDVEFRSYEIGAALFLRKPVRKHEFLVSIERSVRGLSPGRLRQPLMLLSSDVGRMLRCMWRITVLFASITTRVESDAATSLLRHKAKSVADDLISQMQPGADLHDILEVCEGRLVSLNRFCELMERAHVDDVTAYLQSVARDYATMHPKIEIGVQGPDTDRFLIDHSTLFILALCELIDNAVAAVKPMGQIGVTISALPAVGLLHARVHDSGPGVPKSVRERLFQPGISTKGPGRGLGLSLVHDAVIQLGGSVNYECDSGAIFTIDVPMRAPTPALPS